MAIVVPPAASRRPWKQDAMYVVAEIPGGRPGGEVIVQCRQTVPGPEHAEQRERIDSRSRRILADAMLTAFVPAPEVSGA